MAERIDSSKALESKPDPTLCPAAIHRAVGAVMAFGASKPGRKAGGWFELAEGIASSGDVDELTGINHDLHALMLSWWAALERHFLECKRGAVPDPFAIDPESGQTHIAHIGANVAMMLGVLEHFGNQLGHAERAIFNPFSATIPTPREEAEAAQATFVGPDVVKPRRCVCASNSADCPDCYL